MKMSIKETSSSSMTSISTITSNGSQRCPLDDRVMDGLKEELDIFDRLRDACLNEDFNDPIWRHQLNVEVPRDVTNRIDNRVVPTLADLQAESSALDEQIKALEEEDDEIEPFSEPEGLWMSPEDLKASTSSLVAQAEMAEDQVNALRAGIDDVLVTRRGVPFDPVKVPDQVCESMAAAGSVLQKLNELEKAMKKLPLDDRK